MMHGQKYIKLCVGCMKKKCIYVVIQNYLLSWSNVTQNRHFLTIVARTKDSNVVVQRTSTHRTSRTHNKRYAATSPRLTFKNFKLTDFFFNSVTLTRHRRTP